MLFIEGNDEIEAIAPPPPYLIDRLRTCNCRLLAVELERLTLTLLCPNRDDRWRPHRKRSGSTQSEGKQEAMADLRGYNLRAAGASTATIIIISANEKSA